ncbi:PGA52-like protein [Cladobotryum mycophilum]|uniref:glucan endo-1,3-beta-D-glucosidase n=1 Tax=Cladobotryum mycophilum TaxID=491253 RepID=A0ABR0SM35_9HYPO
MKTSAALLATASLATALTQQCTGNAVDEGGNWFCGAVSHILYEGLVGKGSFKAVTHMGDNGECTMEDKTYSGPLAPLDEDLSIHVRGPFQLKEAAVYNLAPKKKMKRDSSFRAGGHTHGNSHRRFHGHQQFHKQKREEWVTATINGQVVSWINNYFGPTTPAPAATPAPPPPASSPENAAPPPPPPPAQVAPKPTPRPDSNGDSHAKAPPKDKSPPAAGSDWDRVAYYSAEKQVADNIIFMGNYGGQGSGLWDTVWGNSLSFLNADGTGGASSPQILKDVYIPSNKEFAIFSAEKCDDSCGYSRDPETAYKGFAGANKVFLFNFKMPLDGDRGFNGDMSALWALNGRIPRTAQYNSCSCWRSGCGEADIFEVLAPGDTKCKSTFHVSNGAGSSDYFERPVDKFIKVATVFDEKTASVSIRTLPDDTDFSEGLNAETVRGWITGGDGTHSSSLFQVS